MKDQEASGICQRAFLSARRKHGGDESKVNRDVAMQAARDPELMQALYTMARARDSAQEIKA